MLFRFRWVQCQLGVLKRCVTAVQVRKALDDLPSSLNETYERILLKIKEDAHAAEVVRNALAWLVVALMPLRLTQIMDGLSVDPDRKVLSRDSGPLHGPALLDALGSLVTYNEVTDVVILSHFSVKVRLPDVIVFDHSAHFSFWQEYLLLASTRASLPEYHVDEQVAHKRLALVCMSYIVIYLQQGQQPGGHETLPRAIHKTRVLDTELDVARSVTDQRSPQPISDFHMLHEYVLCSGFCHLSHINPSNGDVLHALKTLHFNAQWHPLSWDRLCRMSETGVPWPTLKHDFILYILIAFAPARLLRSFIGHAPLKCKDGTNPLIYAANFGGVEHAKILLSSGVCLNNRGCDIWRDHYQLLPLEVALRNGNLPMVNLFLAEGSLVPQELFVHGLTHPFRLPGESMSRLVQTDEFTEWAVSLPDEELFSRALDPQWYNWWSWPSQQDMDKIQQRLVQIGLDPSAWFDETSLCHAVSAGHVSTVRDMLLLNVPFPPDIILDASAGAMPNAEMIRLCLSIGSDVHIVSASTEATPLHLTLTDLDASSEDDGLESLQVLIDAGCDPSRRNLAGETPLHLAVSNGFISIAKHLLALHVPLPPDVLLAASESQDTLMICFIANQGAGVHAVASNGDTPLHRVLDPPRFDSETLLNCVKVLINAGCNLALPNANGETPFDIATKTGNLQVVQYLHCILNSPFPPDILLSVAVNGWFGDSSSLIKFFIDKGASVHVSHPSGDTALHLAASFCSATDRLKRLKLLVNAGCNPRACNLAGETPFFLAAREGDIQSMEYLLSLGMTVPPDIMLSQLEGDRIYGFRQGHAVRFLLDNGGDVHTVAQNGDTLLHLAATLYLEEDALELARHLVRAGCISCQMNLEEDTPLHVAALHGSVSLVKYLLSLNTKLPPDILLAASESIQYSDKAELIRYLVQEGATVSAVTTEGDTPIHLLLEERHGISDEEYDRLECVKILTGAGCNPHIRNGAGETSLHVAARYGSKAILEFLLSQGVPLSNDILLASQTPGIIQFLLTQGLDLRSVAAEDLTELMHRILASDPGFSLSQEKDDVECARILIDSGWDPSPKNLAGETVMHAAATKGKTAVIKFFLSHNVPLPPDILLAAIPLIPGATPNSDTWCLVRFLVREGASVHVTSSNGDTPLHFAVIRDFNPDSYTFPPPHHVSWRLVEDLLNSGSDPYARNVDGRTPYDLAEARGHFSKENFLRLVQNARAHHLSL